MHNIFTNKHHVGVLARHVDDGNAPLPRFTYDATVGTENIVALNMPPAPSADYVYRDPDGARIHPVFAMSLPESTRLWQVLSKALPIGNDFSLLGAVGRSQIGRLRAAPSADPSGIDAVPETSLYDLLKDRGAEDVLNEMFEIYARYSGISGAQPKVLARDNGSLAALSSPQKLSANKLTPSGATHIVKFFEAEKHPALAVNEHLCLRAAKAACLPVPDTWLSDDFQRLIIARFDINDDGSYMAHEDCCALGNFPPDWKYIGSYEQVAKCLRQVIAPAHAREDMALFFRSFVLSVVVRNGDAHMKNFGVIYNTSADVRLTPAYDIISSTPYIPKDTLALTLGGTKRWPTAKRLTQFAVEFCSLTPAEAAETIDRVAEGVSETRKELIARIANAGSEEAEVVLKAMLQIWEDGLAKTCAGVAPRLSSG